ncbi:hypothetical protein ACIA8G_25165 [Lentzea sp. NPDC051213]|uniref:LapA family protein n=1 Tax=Lentzea sp. NPDC051213 TaxID=3364126 RepID=UPI00378C127F
MNIFGQVWLWSLLSFVAGVLLTWLVMVRPARKQIADLEDQLLDARRPVAPIMVPPPVDDFEVDEWDDVPPRSLSDEVLSPPPPAPTPAPAPYVEPPAYFGEPVQAPVVAEEPVAEPFVEPFVEPVAEPEPVAEEPVRQFLEPDEAQRRFEEQLAEQKALADSEDDRPRSLFERLSPDVPEEQPAEQTTVLQLSGLERADFEDYEEQPELPAEQTSFVPVVEPAAEVAPSVPEPTAPPEIDEQADDFIYQPREVWAEDEQEAFLDEAAEQEDEPAVEREFTRSEQTTFIAVEESSWPSNDLTGEYPGLRDEISGQLDGFTEPESPAEQTGLIDAIDPVEPAEQDDLDAPHVRGGVFESTLAEEQAFTEPEPAPEPAHSYREPLEPQVLEPQVFEPEAAHSYREPQVSEPAHAYTEQPEPQAPEPAHSYTEPLEHRKPHVSEPESEGFDEPKVSTAAPFADLGAPAPAPFSAFGSVDDTPERQPRAVAAAFEHVVETPAAPAAPEPVADRPRSLFEPLLDADEPLPATGQTRQLPQDTGNDQPFVPKFVPSDEPLLAAPPEPEPEPVEVELPNRVTEAGLPVREARRTTMQRQQSFPAFQAFDAPKPEAPPAPALPARPRPVGFSPSTGGRPNGAGAPAGSSRFQQPEGFNPRSPFGPGSVLPKSDGHAPAADFGVKATLTGRRYYTEGSANFVETRADVWFRTEADAEKAGFRPAP